MTKLLTYARFVRSFWLLLLLQGAIFGECKQGVWARTSTGIGGGQIEFVDEKHGWLLKDWELLSSSDEGKTWKAILSIETKTSQEGKTPLEKTIEKAGARLMGMQWVDQMNGWALSLDYLYHTIDGGQNWKKQNPGGQSTAGLLAIHFLDIKRGGVLAIRSRYVRNVLRTWYGVYFTDNGGKSWSVSPLTKGSLIYAPRFQYLYFLNATTGFVSAENFILRTKNWGRSWTPVKFSDGEPPDRDFVPDAQFKRVSFVDENVGWVVSREKLYRSDDGGKYWRRVGQLCEGLGQAGEAYFIDRQLGWATCAGGVQKTSDGGVTWVQDPESNAIRGIRSMSIFSKNLHWAVNDEGVFKYSCPTSTMK